jgi:hypothetical protein
VASAFNCLSSVEDNKPEIVRRTISAIVIITLSRNHHQAMATSRSFTATTHHIRL